MAEDSVNNSCILVDAKKVAVHLGLKRGFIYSLVKSKKIPHIVMGDRLIRFDLREIDQWIETLRQPASPSLKSNNAVDADSLINKTVDTAKRMMYFKHHGKPNRNKGLGKESDKHGAL